MRVRNKKTLTDKQKKVITIMSFVAFIVFMAAVGWFVGKPMISFVSEPEKFREWVNSHGVISRFAFIGMVMFQVIIALVPGEPFEIGGGYAFGAIEGTLLCLVGITLGSLVVFFLVRTYGLKFIEVFFSYDKIKSLKFLQNEKRLNLFIFLVFFLPGTPKDLLAYFVGLTKIKMTNFFLLACLARLPSVITSTVGGSALGVKNYTFAIIVFSVTLVISLLGLCIYKQICKYKENK